MPVLRTGRGAPCRGRYFLLVQKVTKDTLRGQSAGSASGAKGAPSLTGGFPPKNPLLRGTPYTVSRDGFPARRAFHAGASRCAAASVQSPESLRPIVLRLSWRAVRLRLLCGARCVSADRAGEGPARREDPARRPPSGAFAFIRPALWRTGRTARRGGRACRWTRRGSSTGGTWGRRTA